ncbi:MAG: twin-arginine translocation signal domain-containing protein, partial [Ktedonobacteraceae bacterium]
MRRTKHKLNFGTENRTGGHISRRAFLATSGAIGVAAAFGPAIITSPARAADKSLKILQWSHFVPSYDKWFDAFAKKWGQDHGVQVSVDHISIADLTST